MSLATSCKLAVYSLGRCVFSRQMSSVLQCGAELSRACCAVLLLVHSNAVHVARVVANSLQHVVQGVPFELRNLLRDEWNVSAVTDTLERMRGHVGGIGLQQNARQGDLLHGLAHLRGVVECDGPCEAKVHVGKCREQSLGVLRAVSEAVQVYSVLCGHVVLEQRVRVVCGTATVHHEGLVELHCFEDLHSVRYIEVYRAKNSAYLCGECFALHFRLAVIVVVVESCLAPRDCLGVLAECQRSSYSVLYR